MRTWNSRVNRLASTYDLHARKETILKGNLGIWLRAGGGAQPGICTSTRPPSIGALFARRAIAWVGRLLAPDAGGLRSRRSARLSLEYFGRLQGPPGSARMVVVLLCCPQFCRSQDLVRFFRESLGFEAIRVVGGAAEDGSPAVPQGLQCSDGPASRFDELDGRLVRFISEKFAQDFVVDCGGASVAELRRFRQRRPYVCSVWVGYPPRLQFQRYADQGGLLPLERFLEATERHSVDMETLDFDLRLYDRGDSELSVWGELGRHDYAGLVRPDWTQYFLRLAILASSRSNCMRRKVGAVIEAGRRVLATGYNGTPSGMVNCNAGGCPRCNDPGVSGGERLDECYCIHAEENALLECGRSAQGASLYCSTFPCLGCAKKLVQVGIRSVFYVREYHYDSVAGRLFRLAGVAVQRVNID